MPRGFTRATSLGSRSGHGTPNPAVQPTSIVIASKTTCFARAILLKISGGSLVSRCRAWDGHCVFVVHSNCMGVVGLSHEIDICRGREFLFTRRQHVRHRLKRGAMSALLASRGHRGRLFMGNAAAESPHDRQAPSGGLNFKEDCSGPRTEQVCRINPPI